VKAYRKEYWVIERIDGMKQIGGNFKTKRAAAKRFETLTASQKILYTVAKMIEVGVIHDRS
jgi:hypothetical protein